MTQEQPTTIHQQIANFLGAKLQNMSISVAEMQDMQTSLNWLASIAKGELTDLSSPDTGMPAAPAQDEAA